jgi:hypothetical protein
MSTHTFIQQNQDRIRNIDGNLDDGNISIIGDDEDDVEDREV